MWTLYRCGNWAFLTVQFQLHFTYVFGALDGDCKYSLIFTPSNCLCWSSSVSRSHYKMGNICMNLEPLMNFNEPIVLFCYLKFADYVAYLSAPINNPFCFLIHCCPSQQFSTSLMLLLVATFSHVIRLRDWLCSWTFYHWHNQLLRIYIY